MTAELKVVPYVELERYVGTWYEIARYPQRFQEGCVASKAVYEIGRHGKIQGYNELSPGFAERGGKSTGKGQCRCPGYQRQINVLHHSA
jgi:apolipoprotein D and lipocalin family protein